MCKIRMNPKRVKTAFIKNEGRRLPRHPLLFQIENDQKNFRQNDELNQFTFATEAAS